MTRRLRQRHRMVTVLFAVMLPVLLVAGLRARRVVPLNITSTTSGAATQPNPFANQDIGAHR